MVPSRNLQRNLRPFANASDEVVLIPPYSFAIRVESKKGKQRAASRLLYFVLGTVNERFDHSGRFDLRAILSGRMESLPTGKVLDYQALRSRETACQFTLCADDLAQMQKVLRISQSTHCGVQAGGDGVQLTLFCADTSNRHWYDPAGLRYGITRLKCTWDSTKVASLKRDCRHRFTKTTAGRVSIPCASSFDASVLRQLHVEDYDVTLFVNGTIEIIGVESGLVFLI